MQPQVPALGTVEAAEGVLKDLYVDLRRKVRQWSEVTRQTPQARMGYVGQHLVSAVTGYPGGRSGARGHDLVLPNDAHAEIKTCSRVDQLGSCKTCGAAVSSVETGCAECEGVDIVRKDDSKWLITCKNEAELSDLFQAEFFYLVLFDFANVHEAVDINARIWRLNPRTPAFAYCMVDYFFNIQAKSQSKAPFNLWPFKLKFDLLCSEIIFHAVIDTNDVIETRIFPGVVGEPQTWGLENLSKYARSGGEALGIDTLRELADRLGIVTGGLNKVGTLRALQEAREAAAFTENMLVEQFCVALYGHRIAEVLESLPNGVPTPEQLTQ